MGGVSSLVIALGGGTGIAAILTALAILFRRSAETKQNSETAARALTPDHGGSVRDKVDYIAKMIQTQQAQAAAEIQSTHEVRALLVDRLDGHDREIKQLRDQQASAGDRLARVESKIDRLIPGSCQVFKEGE